MGQKLWGTMCWYPSVYVLCYWGNFWAASAAWRQALTDASHSCTQKCCYWAGNFFQHRFCQLQKDKVHLWGKQAICAVHHTGAGKVSSHQLPQNSTSHKPVSRKNNFLARATSPRFVRELTCFAVSNLWLFWVCCSNSSISHLPNLALLTEANVQFYSL